MRRLWLLLPLALASCGGGSNSPASPPPNPLYVSTQGKDTNAGGLDAPLRSIRKAAQIALDHYEIVVAPGVYREEVTADRTGKTAQGLILSADLSGDRTQSAPGEVRIDVAGLGNVAGFSLTNSDDVVIDGFTVTGATDGGIVLKSGSDGATIRNCALVDNPGDGIRVQDSARVTVFNNLVYRSGGTGIIIAGSGSGSPDADVINNTVARNGERGITVGNSSQASPNAFLRNNILFQNADVLQLRVITMPRSDLGFDADFDLVQPPTYSPDTAAGAHDLGVDPQFRDPDRGDYHLRSSSPAIDAGDTLAAALGNSLRSRTTTGEGPDLGVPDLGFHYLD